VFQRFHNGKSDDANVNLTPLIDVSLVLVVMLLLATPLAFEASIGVRNAEARAKKAKQEEKHEVIEIAVLSEDEVRVNRQVIPREKLAVTLQPLLERSGTRQVMLSCAGGVSHGTFVDVLDVAKYSGAKEIAVIGR
jgi:biopolymer transport protein ExbD